MNFEKWELLKKNIYIYIYPRVKTTKPIYYIYLIISYIGKAQYNKYPFIKTIAKTSSKELNDEISI